MGITDLVHPDHQQLSRDIVHRLLSGRSVLEETDRRWVHATGRDIWVRIGVTIVRNADSRLTMGIVEDVTTQRADHQQLHYAATHDKLTGLPNRYLVTDRLDHALRSQQRTGGQVGVFFVDQNGFKLINDTHGHAVGDEILQLTVLRLQSHVRPGDTVARMGGDEFIVVSPDLSDLSAVSDLGRRLLDQLNRSYSTKAGTLTVSASVGFAMADNASTSHDLIEQADHDMYRKKRADSKSSTRSGTPQRYIVVSDD